MQLVGQLCWFSPSGATPASCFFRIFYELFLKRGFTADSGVFHFICLGRYSRVELWWLEHVPVRWLQQRHVPQPGAHVQGPVLPGPQQAGPLRGPQIQPNTRRYDRFTFYLFKSVPNVYLLSLTAVPFLARRNQPSSQLQQSDGAGEGALHLVRHGAGVHAVGNRRASLQLARQWIPTTPRWAGHHLLFLWSTSLAYKEEGTHFIKGSSRTGV